MATKSSEVRLVRCPKCLKLLREVENVPVYQCGGCGTFLKAKKRKEHQEGENSEALDPNSAQKHEQGHDSEDKESTCSSQKEIMCSTDGCEQVAYCAKEESASRKISKGITSSGEFNWHEKEESSSAAGGNGNADGTHERGSDLENPSADRQSQKPFVESTLSKFNASPVSEELEISEKIVRRYADLIRPRGALKTAKATDESIISGVNMDDNKLRLRQEVSKPPEAKSFHAYDGSVSSNDGGGGQVSDLHSHHSKTSLSGSQGVAEITTTKGALIREEIAVNNWVGTKSEVQHQTRNLSSMLNENEKQGPLIVGIVGLDEDELPENTVSKPPAGKKFHAYDGSISSSDDEVDQVSDFHSHHSRRSISGSPRVEELTTTNRGPILKEISVNNLIGTKSEVQNQARKLPSMSMEEKQGPVVAENVSLDEDELPENTRYSIQVSKSPAAKSFHAYDGSISSSDDEIDQVSDLDSHHSKRSISGSQRVGELITTNGGPINLIGTKSEVQSQERKLPSMSGNEKQGPVVGSASLDEDELPENTGHSIQVPKPPGAKSFHAYDGSISSNDGCGDQVSDLHSLQSKTSLSGSQRVAELITSNGGPTMEKISTDNLIGTKSEVPNQTKNVSSMSVNEKQDEVVVGSVSLDENELPENSRYRVQEQVTSHDAISFNPVQSWLGLEREELKYKKRLGPRGSSSGGENGGPSKYRHNDSLSSNLYRSKNLESVECNQMELLRKVDELRDQLNKSYAHMLKASERFPTKGNQQERRCPLYCYQNLTQQDMLQQYDVNFPMQTPRTSRPTTSMPLQCGFSQMPRSGNVMNCRHQASSLCTSACKEDWQFQQKLPPPNFCYNDGLCRNFPGHVCYCSYSSCPSSPEWHLHSRCPLRTRDAHMAYEQIDREHNVENFHHRERRQHMKRHCRPIAGAAPFVICYSCQNLLHLPADSLLSTEKSYRLQCGSCLKVLMFSLHKRTQFGPYSQYSAVPQPGEIDSSRASNSIRDSVSIQYVNDNPRGNRFSYSEDFGLSICKSGSTEGDFDCFANETKERKNGTLAMKSRNKQHTSHTSTQASNTGSPSSNKAILLDKPESGEIRREKGPPLHQLMGYASPSKVLYASDDWP